MDEKWILPYVPEIFEYTTSTDAHRPQDSQTDKLLALLQKKEPERCIDWVQHCAPQLDGSPTLQIQEYVVDEDQIRQYWLVYSGSLEKPEVCVSVNVYVPEDPPHSHYNIRMQPYRVCRKKSTVLCVARRRRSPGHVFRCRIVLQGAKDSDE